MSIKTEKPSRETVKKLCCIAAMCLMIPVIMINLILIIKAYILKEEVPDVCGYYPLISLTDESSPRIEEGDLVFCRKIAPDDIVKGEQVTNHTILRPDESGKASITIYVKHGDTVTFAHLPENCVYSVKANDNSKSGYSVRGEVSEQTLTAKTNIDLIWYKAAQDSMIAAGKQYMDLSTSHNQITITHDSSYTFYVETLYTPSADGGLSASICFFNLEGVEQEFPAGTRILMIDKSQDEPSFYTYTVETPKSNIPLTFFSALGATDPTDPHNRFALPTGQMLTEKLLFVVDYVRTGDVASSGEISLVYLYADSVEVISPVKKTVNIGIDTTGLTAVAVNSECAASVGPFKADISVSASSPAVNTTYEGYYDSKYAVALSSEGGTLPDGSYAEVDGKKYYSHNGYIEISPLSECEITANLYLSKPLPDLTGGKVEITAELLSEVSSAVLIPAGISQTIEFHCVEYAMDADVHNKVLNPGTASPLLSTVKYIGVNNVEVTVCKKGESDILVNKHITLPTDRNTVTVNIENEFTAIAGETYILSFVGYANDIPVCSDTCCIVGGYISE